MNFETLNGRSGVAEITEALQLRGKEQQKMFEAASKYRGNNVYVRAAIEPGNVCRQNCTYCGMRRDNKDLSRFRITDTALDRLVDEAVSIPEVDFVHIALGEDIRFPFGQIARQMQKANSAGKTPSLVLGELPEKIYTMLHDAAESKPARFTINLETTDADLFGEIKPGHSFKQRLDKLKAVERIGFQPCSGIIAGLPGQTDEIVARDLLFLVNRGLADISASTFVPSPGSPLENHRRGDDDLTLNFSSIVRLVTKNPGLTITASSSLSEQAQDTALRYFANQVTVHLLPEEYRGLYAIYNGGKRSFQQIDFIRRRVADLGLKFNRTA